MKRIALAALAALTLSIPVQASLSGPELLNRIKQIQNQPYKATDKTHVLCQYRFIENDPFTVDLSFVTPAEYKKMTQGELSEEYTRLCCEVRQAIQPDWDCWYIK